MKKMCMLVLALIGLSIPPLPAEAGYWDVKCYRPCHRCKKVCYKEWVRDRYYWDGGHHRHHRHHGHHGHHGHGHGHHGH